MISLHIQLILTKFRRISELPGLAILRIVDDRSHLAIVANLVLNIGAEAVLFSHG